MPNGDPTVRDIMVKDVYTVLPEVPALQAAQMMLRYGIRHLVVTESLGEVVGVVSQRGILKELSPWLGRGKARYGTPTDAPTFEVRVMMSAPPITTTEDTAISDAAGILASHKIGCLPVTEGSNRLVGIVSAVDVLRFIAGNRLPEPAEEFAVFMPPAFLQEDGTLTLPAQYSPATEPGAEVFVVLAYATHRKRIAVKFFARSHQEEETAEELPGARPVTLIDGHLTVPMQDFLQIYKVGTRGPLTVTEDQESGYLILSPIPSS